MKLSVVIVNYNVKYFLAQCLHSLYKALQPFSAEVIVVDNASKDESQAYIQRLYPQVQYIFNVENVGFARANNQALRLCKGEYVLLLNPDTILPEDNIQQVLDFMEEHPEAGACGVRMHSGEGNFLPESKRGYPSPEASFWRLSGLYRLFPNNPRFDAYYLSRFSPNEHHAVPVLAGAYMMMRRDAVVKAGLFDEDFFMYGEDIDLSCRIEEAGYTNYYLSYPILHYKGESTKKLSYRYVSVFYDAMHIFFRKRGQHYNFLSRSLVHGGIHLQCGLKMAVVAVHRSLLRFVPDREVTTRFVIFAHAASVEGIQKLITKHDLTGPHHFIISNERSAALGHDIVISQMHTFTHVVYDTRVFSYTKMLDLITNCQLKYVELGVYHPKQHLLVTPGNNYI